MKSKPSTILGDRWITILAAVAGLFGAFCILNAGYPRALSKGEGLISSEFLKHMLWLVVSGITYLLFVNMKSTRIRNFGVWFFALSFVGAILVLIPGIGISANGSARWIGFGPFTIQPGELLKPATILFLAIVVSKTHNPIRKKYHDFVEWLDYRAVPWTIRSIPFILIFAAIVLVEKEPDLGTAMMIASAAFGVLLFSKTSAKILVGIVLVGVVFIGVAAFGTGYRHDRLANHGNRWQPGIVDGPGFQTAHSELAMAYGGVFGVGIGQGRAKHVLPAATTDFVFTTASEELGLIGTFIVLFLLGGISLRLIILAGTVKDNWSKAVIGATGWWIGTQTAFNLLMAGGMLPPVGIPLPFVSYGGSSLLALAIGLGISQAALRSVPVMEGQVETNRNRRRYRRPRFSRA